MILDLGKSAEEKKINWIFFLIIVLKFLFYFSIILIYLYLNFIIMSFQFD